jgi:hypothetical protein
MKGGRNVNDIVILKNGDSVSGEVQNKVFTINTPTLGKLKIPTKNIHHIHFKGSQFAADVIEMGPVDMFQGQIEGKTVSLKMKATGETSSLDMTTIHTIMFLGNV